MIEELVIGVLSGLVSGAIIYYITKHREKKRETYYFLLDYLFKIMERLEVEIPSGILRYSSQVGGKDTEWGKAIDKIFDMTRQCELKDREFTDDENELAETLITAVNELSKWAIANHIEKKRN